ncbi:MAG: ABC transporter permease [Clostridia bacterium]|nr:ABC transporter permease [Clostridia bacterium]
MTKYLLKRLLHGVLSIIAVVAIVMILVYSLMDRTTIFAADTTYSKIKSNAKIAYMHRQWEQYGYLDYVPYADYINELYKNGEIASEEERAAVVKIARKEFDSDGNPNDSEQTRAYIKKFTEYYESKGYTVVRKNAEMMTPTRVVSGGDQILFATKDTSVFVRLFRYFTNLISVDNIHYTAKETEIAVENPGLTFTLKDPLYGGEKLSPAIIGNGTKYKYLLYCDDQFPYIHQNLVTLKLGQSYSVNMGVDVFQTMTNAQGSYVKQMLTYPTGLQEEGAENLHTATYVAGSHKLIGNNQRYTDDYTACTLYRSGMSRMGYSFVIGILASIMAYLLGVPLGIWMARKKDSLIDKLGTFYIVFIIAVPSLAYIFLFKAIGTKIGLPGTFLMDSTSKLMFVLPIVSLALPSIATLMKWLRRYMIDQMNSDYVRFARSGGLSEREIFSKHILKNAVIPIVHGIPGSILGALTGAIITERVYVVPGAGNLLTEAINRYDNAVIVGVTLFYAVLSVLSIIMGDILMAMVDPRISYTSKAR